MCVALSFLFGYILSTRCVYPQIGRAFEAPIGHKTLLCGYMVLLAPFVAYLLKNNYSQRQIILKNLRVWERSLISVPIGVYFGLIEVETRLEKAACRNEGRLQLKSDRTLHRSIQLVFLQLLKEDRMMNSVSTAFGVTMFQRSVGAGWILGKDQTLCYVRSRVIGCVRSWFEGLWTSLLLTGLQRAACDRLC